MRTRPQNQQYLLGLGAAGAVAVLAVSLAYAVSQRRRRQPYTKLEWETSLEEIGVIRNFDDIVDEIADRGLEPCIRPDVWPFLLEVFDSSSAFQQRQAQHQLMVRQYQQLLLQCQAYEAALKESLRPASPALACAGTQQQQQQQQQQVNSPKHQQQQCKQQIPEQVRQFAEAHRIIVIDAVRTDFEKHTAAIASLYRDVGYAYSSGSSADASRRDSITAAASAAASSFAASTGVAAVASLVSNGLNSLQQYWLGSLLGGQAAAWGHQQALWVSEAAQLVLDNSAHMQEESKRQACRMIAMLSAYALHDPDTGYCQGMSDLLLPFVLLMEDDALAFWCFVALMQRQGLRRNFAADESGIFAQLRCLGQVLEANDRPLMFRLHQLGAAECHFAYRMVVVMMRRDLGMDKVMQLWEVLWADAWQKRRQQVSAAAAALPGGRTAGSKDILAEAAEKAMQLVADSRSDGSQLDKQQQQQHQNGHQQEELQALVHSNRLDLFICFVAAVIISHRRPVLDHCHDAEDVLRLFHSMRQVDVWQCLVKAQELQQAMLGQSHGPLPGGPNTH